VVGALRVGIVNFGRGAAAGGGSAGLDSTGAVGAGGVGGGGVEGAAGVAGAVVPLRVGIVNFVRGASAAGATGEASSGVGADISGIFTGVGSDIGAASTGAAGLGADLFKGSGNGLLGGFGVGVFATGAAGSVLLLTAAANLSSRDSIAGVVATGAGFALRFFDITSQPLIPAKITTSPTPTPISVISE
jgi:hypothetical protein